MLDLYETDYNLWVLETVKHLQNRDPAALDWEHLIEEVADLGRRDKKRLKSLMRNLIEHLLKLRYWEAERDRNGAHWKGEIANFRKQIRDELEDSPSLRRYLEEIYPQCYEDAREIASIRSQLPLDQFPQAPEPPLKEVLEKDWLP